MAYEFKRRHMILVPQEQLEHRKYLPRRPRCPASVQLPSPPPRSYLSYPSSLPPPMPPPMPIQHVDEQSCNKVIDTFMKLQIQDRYQKYLQERIALEPEASVRPDIFCSTCSTMGERQEVYNDPTETESYRQPRKTAVVILLSNLDALLRSASQGCHHCTLLSDSLQMCERRRLLDLNGLRLHDETHTAWVKSFLSPSLFDQQLALRVWYDSTKRFELVGLASDDSDQHLAERILASGTLDSDRRIGNDITRDPNSIEGKARFSLWTGSHATFALARSWISTCKHRHKKCSGFKAPASSLPARIIDVQPTIDSASIQLKSVSDITGGGLADSFQYLTLSHRWSRHRQLRLEKENLLQLYAGVDDSILSLTFQHAIAATRRMFYRYIWIDSLCIIQNCEKDWQQESAIMGDIYRGSDCTLGALVDPDAQAGLFRMRDAFAPFGIRYRANSYLRSSKPDMEERLPEGTLQSRGWVLQERVLSPRTLYFCEDQIMWECCETSANEGCPIQPYVGAPSMKYYIDPKKEFFGLTLQSISKLSKPDQQLTDFQAAWSQILHIYTNCDLTVPADKLVAINGIIRKIEQETMLQAAAGLWKQILPAELLWFTSLTKRKSQRLWRNTSYHAPSWSWASTDLPIFNDYASFMMRTTEKVYIKWYLRVVTVTVDALPNGQVRSGSLIIRAPIKKIELSALADYEPCRDFAIKPKEGSGLFRSYGSSQVQKYWTPDFAGVEGDDIYAVLVARRKRYRSPVSGPKRHDIFHDGRCNMCIVVKKVGEGATFQRVGHLQEHHWKLDKWPIFTIFDSRVRSRITLI